MLRALQIAFEIVGEYYAQEAYSEAMKMQSLAAQNQYECAKAQWLKMQKGANSTENISVVCTDKTHKLLEYHPVKGI
jgi:hypothetical protein